MPGHIAAAFGAYPELAGDGVDPATTNLDRSPWLQHLHPDNPSASQFLSDVLGEVVELTPGAFLHVGGDEALGMDPELYARMVSIAREIVRGLGKEAVGWQETARAGLEPGSVIQSWLSPTEEDIDRMGSAAPPEGVVLPPDAQEMRAAFEEAFRVMVTDLDRALEQDASVVVSFQPVAYLDTKYREASSDPEQAAQLERVGMPFYAPSTVEEFYSWDPSAIRPSLMEDRIAGVEAAIWCEFVETFDDLLFLLLPRLPGVLEKGWAAVGSGWEEYAPRLAAQAPLWERHGWQYYRSSVVWSDPV
jgi:hexosaminidase